MRIIKPAGEIISPGARVLRLYGVKVIKCKVKIIKCNIRVIEGRVNEVIRSGH